MVNGCRFHFVVPLLAKSMAGTHWHVADNPDGRSAEAAVSRCLSSLINQTVPCVIHLVCHDVPNLTITTGSHAVVNVNALAHPRNYLDHVRHDTPTIVIHQVDFPTPDLIDRDTYERLSGKPISSLPNIVRRRVGDKYSKFKIGLGAVLHDPASHFVMLVDHDDLIHRDVVAYAIEHDGLFTGGHTVTSGYAWRVGDDVFRKMDAFHKTCGSCNAVRLSEEEHEQWCAFRDIHRLGTRKQHWLFAGHGSVFERLRKSGRETAKFPFRAAVYVTDTGANISGTKKQGRDKLPLTESLAAEFGLRV